INCGYLTPSHFIPLAAPGVVAKGLRWMFDRKSPLYIKPRANRELIKWLWDFYRSSNSAHVERTQAYLLDLNLQSRDLYQQIAAEEKLEFQFNRKGLLILAQTKKGLEEERHLSEVANRLGLKTRMLSRKEVRQLEPDLLPDVLGACFYPEDGHIHPADFMGQMKNLLAQSGVNFHWGTAVQDLKIQDSRVVSIETASKSFLCDEVLLAAGSWSAYLARKVGLDMPLQGGKGYSMTLSNPPKNLRHPAILTEKKIAMTPFTNGLRIGGTMEFAGLDTSINTTRVEAIKAGTQAFFPEIRDEWLDDVKIDRGLRPVSPDGMPYIGRVSSIHNLTVASGHAMLGMSMGPISGKLIAEVLSGQKMPDQFELLNPNRFSRSKV
ncbi:MAG: FAD-dependent oxidoreductase, partial [Flavobacteriales bacterium]|nr:FAD-dependent oxidoreductase [Flavobacteriales bacterium]